MLIPAITIGIGSCQYTFEKGAAKAEFADSKSPYLHCITDKAI
jgi:hypothetical protein